MIGSEMLMPGSVLAISGGTLVSLVPSANEVVVGTSAQRSGSSPEAMTTTSTSSQGVSSNIVASASGGGPSVSPLKTAGSGGATSGAKRRRGKGLWRLMGCVVGVGLLRVMV